MGNLQVVVPTKIDLRGVKDVMEIFIEDGGEIREFVACAKMQDGEVKFYSSQNDNRYETMGHLLAMIVEIYMEKDNG